uniref:Neur_chan_LBD domain-containing protein n=1 Tax=Macrostomum lignano TaxID=282301 RepID=A0A1I8H1L7_9PLAT
DEVNQVLTTNVWLEQEWQDERLHWDPSDYNGLQVLRVPCQKIWLPDIVLYNSADDFTTGYMQSKAMVDSSGTVFWPPPAKLRSTCKIDITYFPFDDQVCTMKFGSWTYDDGSYKNRSLGGSEFQTVYPISPVPYPDIKFHIVIQRRTLYYLFNIIFPCLWLTVLSLLGFWLPPDSGEKITLGITVLLAFSVFMLLIAENMPATSEFVPLI